MKFDFNKVLDRVIPQPIELTLDGKDYTLKRLSVADVAMLEGFGKAVAGESAQQQTTRVLDGLRSLFEGPTPPFLDPIPDFSKVGDEEMADRTQRIIALTSTIAVAYEDLALPKLAMRAREEASQQLRAMASTS